MVLIDKPLICPVCGREMTTYSFNNNTGRIVFSCPKKHVRSLTEEEYKKEINSSGRP